MTPQPASRPIAEDWAGDYPPGTPLFCARFDAEDFDELWGAAAHPDGETIAVRAAERPSAGFFARHRDRPAQQLGCEVIERHMSARALEIFYDLGDDARAEFVETWAGGTFAAAAVGKAPSSNRSSRRAASRKRR